MAAAGAWGRWGEAVFFRDVAHMRLTVKLVLAGLLVLPLAPEVLSVDKPSSSDTDPQKSKLELLIIYSVRDTSYSSRKQAREGVNNMVSLGTQKEKSSFRIGCTSIKTNYRFPSSHQEAPPVTEQRPAVN